MKEILIEYGLSDKEADIYLAALTLGETTASRIVKHTGMRRSTVYEILDALRTKKLVSSYKKEKKYHFVASAPETFIQLTKEKERLIRGILPDLEQLQKQTTNRPELMLYEGKIGLKTAAEEMLKAEEILLYGASIRADEQIGPYIENFARRRVQKGITLKCVIGESVPEHMIIDPVQRKTEIRGLESMEDHEVTYFIFDDVVLMWILGNPLFTVRIENKVFADSQRAIFEQLWKSAESR